MKVVLHIGLPKSATTTMQNLLSENRGLLETAGLGYPVISPPSQLLAFAALMSDDEESIESMPPGTAARHLQLRGQCDEYWDGLLSYVQQHRGVLDRVVLSAENLVYAGGSVIERVGDAFEGLELEVVVTYRHLIKTIPSVYQQEARTSVVAPFSAWVHAALVDLADSRWSSSTARLSAEQCARRWSPVAAAVHQVPVDSAIHGSSIEAAWHCMTGLPMPETLHSRPAMNLGLTPPAVDAIQQLLKGRHGVDISRLNRAVRRAFWRAPVARDADLGGSFSLDLDSSVREEWPHTPGSDDGAAFARHVLAEWGRGAVARVDVGREDRGSSTQMLSGRLRRAYAVEGVRAVLRKAVRANEKWLHAR